MDHPRTPSRSHPTRAVPAHATDVAMVDRAKRICAGRIALALLATVVAHSAGAATIAVSNTNDLVNGDTSSLQALIAMPGPDGISLREAFLAANNSPGPHTITFAPALAGQTISPTTAAGCCYIITQDGVTVAGLSGPDGQPAVTIDASNMSILFSVTASNFTLTSLRIIGLQAANPGAKTGVFVRPDAASGKVQVSNIVVRGNVFNNNPGVTAGIAVVLGPELPATGTLLSNVTIADNVFNHFQSPGGTDAVKVQATGTNNTVQDVLISGNTFTDITYPIEVIPTSAGNRILRTRIVGNSFSSSKQVINFNIIGFDGQPPTTGNVIDDILIERNVFRANVGPVIVLIAGLTEPSGSLNTTGNTITNTRIVNNLIAGNTFDGTIRVFGGLRGSTQNSISGVSIVNNTLANNNTCGSGFCEGAITVKANLEFSSGNSVAGVSVLNTILWNNTIDLTGLDPAQVRNSITTSGGFAGVNGNLNADPKFVNSAQQDFHLQAGSPAIGKGAGSGAPFGDLDCQPRGAPPSIGAYELNGPAGCTGIVPLAAVLPAGRSVQTGNLATAFATILNTGIATARACGLMPSTSLPASFIFQTTDPTTNAATRTANTPIDISAGAAQTYVFGFAPSGAFAPTDAALAFTCANTLSAPTIIGVNTLLLSASTSPVPDLIAVGLTPSNDGVVRVLGVGATGIFVIASTNIGIAAPITARARLSNSGMPVTALVCETNPSSGTCKQPPSPTVTRTIVKNENTTWTAFLQGNALLPFDPANSRVFFEFTDGGGAVRGSTSAAVAVQ